MQFERNVTPESARDTFRRMANHEIPNPDDYSWVCRKAAAHYNTLPNHVDIDVDPGDRVIFVGDLHGCFETLIRLFLGDASKGIPATGFPGDIVGGRRNVYLFNGDFIDRGGSGYQIVFALALFSISNGDCCLMNRGNHESDMFGLSTQTGIGNKYMLEVAGKFPSLDFNHYRPATCEFFYSLPIAHTFDGNIFVVHGGVPMGNDLSGVPRATPSYFSPGTPQAIPRNLKPYVLSNLDTLVPTRQQTTNFEDNPRRQSELWHSFVWSYDRMPYSADFMEANKIKTMVHSHTATPYHQITTFLPMDKPGEKYAVHSVVKSDEMFQRVKAFFDTHQLADSTKLCILEIFSSPTNNGNVYAAVINAKPGPKGKKLEFDPFKWDYVYLGAAADYTFVQTSQ